MDSPRLPDDFLSTVFGMTAQLRRNERSDPMVELLMLGADDYQEFLDEEGEPPPDFVHLTEMINRDVGVGRHYRLTLHQTDHMLFFRYHEGAHSVVIPVEAIRSFHEIASCYYNDCPTLRRPAMDLVALVLYNRWPWIMDILKDDYDLKLWPRDVHPDGEELPQPIDVDD